jgi:hypothetical protein
MLSIMSTKHTCCSEDVGDLKLLPYDLPSLRQQLKDKLPATLFQLQYYWEVVEIALVRLARGVNGRGSTRKQVIDRLIQLVQDEVRKREQESQVFPTYSKHGVTRVHSASQTDLILGRGVEFPGAKEEYDKILETLMQLLKYPDAEPLFNAGGSFDQTEGRARHAATAAVGVDEVVTEPCVPQSSEYGDSSCTSSSNDSLDGADRAACEQRAAQQKASEEKLRREAEEQQRAEVLRNAVRGEGAAKSAKARFAKRTNGSSQSAKAYPCNVCKTRETQLILLPCGHFCMCIECSKSYSQCPVCNVPIQATVRAYCN